MSRYRFYNFDSIFNCILAVLLFLFNLNSINIKGIKVFYLIIPFILIYFLLKKKINLYLENKLFFLFVFLSFISAFTGFINNESSLSKDVIFESLILLLIGIICLFVTNVITIRHIEIYSKISIILSLIFFIDYLKNFDGYRYQGFFNDPNYFNSSILLLIFFNIMCFEIINSNIKKNIIFFSNLILIFVSISTASRSGILGLSIFMVFYILYILTHKGYLHLLKSLIMIIIVTIFIYNFDLMNIKSNFSYLVERILMKSSNDSGSAMMRFSEARNGLNLMKENPISLILGNGTGVTTNINWFSNYVVSLISHVTRVHNTYMALLVENGILGLFTFLLTIFTPLILTIKNLKNDYKYIYIGLGFSQIAIAFFIWNIKFIPFCISFFIIGKFYRENKEDN